jgi:hypothetical protein
MDNIIIGFRLRKISLPRNEVIIYMQIFTVSQKKME